MSGDLNGNAAFGAKNSPDSSKIAAAIKKWAAADTPCSCGCGDTVATCKCGKDCKCRKPGGSCYKAEKSAFFGQSPEQIREREYQQRLHAMYKKLQSQKGGELTEQDMAPLYEETMRHMAGEKEAAQPNSFMGGVTDWANNAIQTPMGQKALGGVASAYNSYMPQVGKKMVSHMMPSSTTEPFNDQSFQHGSFIGSQDTLHERTTTGPNGSNSTNNLSSQIQQYSPVQVTGTPLQQLGYGLSNNAMPAQTFQQGQNAFLDTKIDNDAITRSHLRATPGPDLDGNPVEDWTKRSMAGEKESAAQTFGRALAIKFAAKSPAWQREAGKNEEGGLNAKGRASYNKATGGNLKAPVTQKNPKGKARSRRASFCARMGGMKKKLTGEKTKNDPDSRINKALRKWNC